MINLLNKIHLGDCLEIIQALPDNCIDVILTDPPYGLGKKMQGGTWGANKGKNMYWDTSTCQYIIDELLCKAKTVIIWGGNYYSLSPTRCALIWYKRDSPPTMADCEIAWTNMDKNSKVFDWTIAATNPERVGHPTQKPLQLFKWCLKQTGLEKGIVLDPFSGSGTTALACHDLGLDFICIEKDPDYHAASVKRLEAHQRQLKLI